MFMTRLGARHTIERASETAPEASSRTSRTAQEAIKPLETILNSSLKGVESCR